MIALILIALIILWFLGFIHLPFLPVSDFVLFNLFGRAITLYDVLVFLLIIWLVDLLPGPFREIAVILLALWLLSLFGVIAVIGLTNVIVMVVIFGLVYYLLTGGN